MIFNYMCFDVFMSYVWLLTQMVVTLLVTEHPSTPKKASNITRSIIRTYPFACFLQCTLVFRILYTCHRMRLLWSQEGPGRYASCPSQVAASGWPGRCTWDLSVVTVAEEAEEAEHPKNFKELVQMGRQR